MTGTAPGFGTGRLERLAAAKAMEPSSRQHGMGQATGAPWSIVRIETRKAAGGWNVVGGSIQAGAAEVSVSEAKSKPETTGVLASLAESTSVWPLLQCRLRLRLPHRANPQRQPGLVSCRLVSVHDALADHSVDDRLRGGKCRRCGFAVS